MKYLQSIFLISVLFLTGINLYSQGLEPVLLEPENDTKCLDLDVDFSWTQKVNATSYDLQVTTVSGSYTNPVVNETGITTTSTSAVLSDNSATYYWRVKANYSSTFAWSDEFTFETKRAGTNTMVPNIGMICQDNPVMFEWAPLPNVTSYQLQVSPNASFNSPEINNNSIASNTFSAALNQSYTAYFWRVRANYTSGTTTCTSEWSNSASFTTEVTKPNLDQPVNNAKGIDFNVNFTWMPENGSASYTFQLAETPSFGTITQEVINHNDSQLMVQLTEDYNKVYYWRVKASSADLCESNWSDTFTFKTRFADVTLDEPANEAKCIPVNGAMVTWNESQGVASYRLQISENPNFPTPVQFDISNITSNSYTLDLPNSLTKFHWRVRAEDNNNIGNWSERREFTSGLFSPNLLLPVNDSTETFIIADLSWESQNSIANYNLQVASSSDFSPESMIVNEVGYTDENYSATLTNYGVKYYWRVSASFTECLSNWSETRNFTTMTGTPTLVSPENNATNTPLDILFDWSDVKYKKNYDIEISTSSDFAVIEKGRIAVDTSVILISGLKPSTKYYWRVRTNTGISKAPYSVIRSFTTGVEPSIRPTKIEPKDLTDKQAIERVFRWFKSSDANYYDLQITTDENFTNVDIAHNDLSDTLLLVTDLENFTTYYWRVRSGNTAGVSAWTEPWAFKTIAPSVTDSATLNLPADNATEINHKKAVFEWFPVDNTLDVKGAFQLQISTTPNFQDGTVKYDTRSVFLNTHTVFSLDHTTDYFWRVRGFNEAGDGPWSETWSFKTLDLTSVKSDKINNVTLYPNPINQDYAKLSFDLKNNGLTSIVVYDIKGNKVFEIAPKLMNKGNHNINLNLSNISNGTYYLLIDNEGNQTSINLNITK